MNKASLYVHSFTFCCSLTHLTVVQLAHLRLSVFNSTGLQNANDISLTEYNTVTTLKLSRAVGTTIELKNVGTTSDSTDTILSQNMPHSVPLLSDVVGMFLC